MARDILTSFTHETGTRKVLFLALLAGFLFHLAPWVRLGEPIEGSIRGFQSATGHVSGILLGVALALLVYRLAAELSRAGRSNTDLGIVVTALSAVVCEACLYLQFGQIETDALGRRVLILSSAPAWGLHVSVSLTAAAACLALFAFVADRGTRATPKKSPRGPSRASRIRPRAASGSGDRSVRSDGRDPDESHDTAPETGGAP